VNSKMPAAPQFLKLLPVLPVVSSFRLLSCSCIGMSMSLSFTHFQLVLIRTIHHTTKMLNIEPSKEPKQTKQTGTNHHAR
jgi:hypothetical protein